MLPMNRNSLIWMKEFLKEDNLKILKHLKENRIPLIDYGKLEEFYKDVEAKGIKIITYFDNEYPEKLKRIYNPPLVLYVKGNIDLLYEKSIGIVGSRKCTAYGRNISTNFAKILAEKYVVVSGMAFGIDAAAHKGALKSGKTIAVLGSGVDVAYPRSNVKLYEDILNNGGCIVSEYRPGTPATPFRFPERNRIIVGLSEGIIVVEAAKKSGSLITARLAVESGIDVYAIPGDITRKSSEGTNELIYNGAIPLISEKVLKEIFNIEENKKTKRIENEDDLKIIMAIDNGYNTFEGIVSYTRLSTPLVLQRLTILVMNKIIFEENGRYHLGG
ncbi:hypothetical protein XO11_06970 [Marinitoga sp. 1138]|nr:hypothetical protein [Marinitoga sp. 1138]